MTKAMAKAPVQLTETDKSLLAGQASRAAEPAWATEARQKAIEEFTKHGLPHKRIETWKYTDIRERLSGTYQAPGAVGSYPELDKSLAEIIGDAPAIVVKVVDGQVQGWTDSVDLVPANLTLETLTGAMSSESDLLRSAFSSSTEGADQSVRALNSGLATEGVLVDVAPQTEVAPLIVIAHLSGASTPTAEHVRHIIRIGANASARIVEVHLSEDNANQLTTVGIDIQLADGAQLARLRVLQDAGESTHLSTTRVRIERDARYNTYTLMAGGRTGRDESLVTCAEPGADIRLGAALLLDGNRHGDVTARIVHEAPHCQSEQDVRAVLAGQSRGVAQGAVSVAEKAIGTDGRQLIKGLLLSRKAEFDAKPELEILADDVKCAHGATTGELDASALFYLRSRGVPEAQARLMLTYAFLVAGIDGVSDKDLRDIALRRIQAWLETHSLGGGDDQA